MRVQATITERVERWSHIEVDIEIETLASGTTLEDAITAAFENGEADVLDEDTSSEGVTGVDEIAEA